MERTLDEELMDHLTKTQEVERSSSEHLTKTRPGDNVEMVSEEELKRMWNEVAYDSQEPQPAKLKNFESLNRGFQEYFQDKAIKVRGSWEEYVFDEVIYEEAAGTYPYKLKLRGRTNPENIAIVDPESLAERVLVEKRS